MGLRRRRRPLLPAAAAAALLLLLVTGGWHDFEVLDDQFVNLVGAWYFDGAVFAMSELESSEWVPRRAELTYPLDLLLSVLKTLVGVC